ncbi:uncharacterized protein LOC120359597 [Solenopsis invicta]|uniref:uncharacterized protein LOC120359597 n=1 Tax=Solenopsis invicta TaxID=13686 RepID=UPI00193E1951|nr:uncharacterized protein LOC120359597 [Solenopsis invicta]
MWKTLTIQCLKPFRRCRQQLRSTYRSYLSALSRVSTTFPSLPVVTDGIPTSIARYKDPSSYTLFARRALFESRNDCYFASEWEISVPLCEAATRQHESNAFGRYLFIKDDFSSDLSHGIIPEHVSNTPSVYLFRARWIVP